MSMNNVMFFGHLAAVSIIVAILGFPIALGFALIFIAIMLILLLEVEDE